MYIFSGILNIIAGAYIYCRRNHVHSERSEEKINNPRCEVILSGDYIIAGLLIYSNRNTYIVILRFSVQ